MLGDATCLDLHIFYQHLFQSLFWRFESVESNINFSDIETNVSLKPKNYYGDMKNIIFQKHTSSFIIFRSQPRQVARLDLEYSMMKSFNAALFNAAAVASLFLPLAFFSGNITLEAFTEKIQR